MGEKPWEVSRRQSSEVLELPSRTGAETSFAFQRMELHHTRTTSCKCQEEQGPSSTTGLTPGRSQDKTRQLLPSCFSIQRPASSFLKHARDFVLAFANFQIMSKNRREGKGRRRKGESTVDVSPFQSPPSLPCNGMRLTAQPQPVVHSAVQH